MAARKKATVVVLVERNWYDEALRLLIGQPKSRSTTGVHVLVGGLKDDGGPVGLWMNGITTRQLKQDGSEVAMEFLIPWRFIVGVGVVDKVDAKIGFQGSDVTVMT